MLEGALGGADLLKCAFMFLFSAKNVEGACGGVGGCDALPAVELSGQPAVAPHPIDLPALSLPRSPIAQQSSALNPTP